eukprot:CAMPEP_0172496184 /NCGR_PEP_ID=MMETSP1066-20121228/82981_1 /TAXON_ID=671091 /ORGANISM="Coscinodiscus wailesii, Strain CCMP2513" /LENGTH=146 /DNA_ID=CAMNT_0013268355 /DNA_START=51 /DNA_END=488 /DNA_ORIENTATION=+
MSNASDSDDEWDEDNMILPEIGDNNTKNRQPSAEKNRDDDDDVSDDYWDETPPTTTTPVTPPPPAAAPGTKNPRTSGAADASPLIIVDLTLLSNAAIHSRFDKNSVNDPVAASTFRRRVEDRFEEYRNDSKLLANGSVIPCGGSVW